MPTGNDKPLALWAITSRGLALARRLAPPLDADLFRSAHLDPNPGREHCFERLTPAVADHFSRYRGHVFFMSTGIVVRLLAPLIRHKTLDPAVVVVDEQGRHAISLLAGHIGGANALAQRIAAQIGAAPVITTATDLAGLPAVDLLAREQGLAIENPEAIRHVSSALLGGVAVGLHDPLGLIAPLLPPAMFHPLFTGTESMSQAQAPGVCVEDRLLDLPPGVLLLRPRSLVAGIGCNRGASENEIVTFIIDVMIEFKYCIKSLTLLASIDLKRNEPGLLATARRLDLPLRFYGREALATVSGVQSPSATVARHIGVSSVCEASALLAARSNRLLVKKQKRGNVTLALARRPSMLSD